MADANLRIVIDALNKAGDDLKGLEKQLKGIDKTSKETGKETEKLSGSFKDFLSTAGMVAAGVGTAYIALKKFYDFAKQGAELEYTADKFDRLADSIGTTADVLLTELRDATKGTRSDMELMASATDFVALGFAKTKDEAVRLATVAGALNMNMNQLVLTLANQTTMRFDQLGVAVEGFDERLQALKATGMDTNAAFKEAFLQQAEAQIGKVGNAADSTAGDFMRLEAALKNIGNAAKTELSEGLAPAIKESADLFTLYAERIAQEQAFDALQSKLKKAGISVQEFNKRFYDTQNLANWVVDIEGYNALLEDMQSALDAASGGVDMLAENLIEEAILLKQIEDEAAGAGDAVVAFAVSSEKAALAVDNFLEKAGLFKDDFAEIFSLSKNMSGMISFAKSYDDITAKIIENNMKLAGATGEMAASIEADTAKLQAQLTDMANQVTLDMFQATIAVGGVTQAEMQAYFQMAEGMGLISEAGAQAAMDAYNNAITTINGYEIEEKTGNVVIDALAAMATLDFLQAYALADKEMRVFIKTYYGSGSDNYWEDKAAGGEVKNAASGVAATLPHYWVGELGPEPFFPETNGRIVSNTQAMSALRSGAEGGGSSQPIVVNITTPVNLADRVWVERELAPYIRDALRKAGK